MKAHEVIGRIKALPATEKAKVVDFVQQEVEAQLLSEESPEMLAAIDEGVRSLNEAGGRIYSRAQLERKVRKWAIGASR